MRISDLSSDVCSSDLSRQHLSRSCFLAGGRGTARAFRRAQGPAFREPLSSDAMLPAARRSGEPGGAGAAGTRRAATGARLAAGTARLHSRDRSRARLAFGLRAGDPRAGRRRNVDIPAWMYFGEAPSGRSAEHTSELQSLMRI